MIRDVARRSRLESRRYSRQECLRYGVRVGSLRGDRGARRAHPTRFTIWLEDKHLPTIGEILAEAQQARGARHRVVPGLRNPAGLKTIGRTEG